MRRRSSRRPTRVRIVPIMSAPSSEFRPAPGLPNRRPNPRRRSGSIPNRDGAVTEVDCEVGVIRVVSFPGRFLEGATVSTLAALSRRLVAYAAALMLCAGLAPPAVAPVARADGRTLLAGAIANTRGSYLVYNFGDGHPAPMLNAGGGWYEMNSGGHLMTIKNAAGRLQPRLLVDSHQGYQGRCERDPGRARAKVCGRPPRSYRAAGGVAGARSADDRDQRELLRRARPEGRFVARHEMQFAARRLRRQHARAGPGQRRRHRHARVRGQAGAVGRQRALVRRWPP